MTLSILPMLQRTLDAGPGGRTRLYMRQEREASQKGILWQLFQRGLCQSRIVALLRASLTSAKSSLGQGPIVPRPVTV
jgi:hypothetical protein